MSPMLYFLTDFCSNSLFSKSTFSSSVSNWAFAYSYSVGFSLSSLYLIVTVPSSYLAVSPARRDVASGSKSFTLLLRLRLVFLPFRISVQLVAA